MKSKKILILLMGVLLLLYMLPFLLFQLQDFAQSKNVVTLDNIYKISSEASDIKLVNIIHTIAYATREDDYIYDSEDLLKKKDILKKEVKKLYEYGILDADALKTYEEIQSGQWYNISVYNRRSTFRESYTTKDNYVGGDIMMESETNKVLSLKLPYDSELTDRKSIIYSYIQYLGLDILDDWSYTNGEYVSQKAQLRANVQIYEFQNALGMQKYLCLGVNENYAGFSNEQLELHGTS